MFRGVCSAIFVLAVPLLLLGQNNASAVFSVPLVGCKSDGQVGPIDAPTSGEKVLLVNRGQALQLAYYKASVLGAGVLAPRGWHCFAVYGSGGAALRVSPQPVDAEHILQAAQEGITGPAIVVALRDGDTSGRYEVAEVIGRVFPAYRNFARFVLEDLDQSLPPGPFPADLLSYKSDECVEYKTPAGQEGLGTRWPFRKGSRQTQGVAVLFGKPPSLLQLSVRLPNNSEELASAIIAQFHRDASSLPVSTR